MRRALVLAALLLGMLGGPARAAVGSQVIFNDPLTGTPGQHATAVEPDSFSFGNTVVAAFQVGRTATRGAAAIGWATSADGGRTWRSGLLPRLTPYTSAPGPYSRVSDPAVAYDRVHGVWLVSVLAVNEAPGRAPTTALVVSRSADGISWGPPVITSPDVGTFAHDKNWIACDNGARSRFAGRCYTAWSDMSRRALLVLSTSLDGGLTWGAPAAVPTSENSMGAQPVVRPDGSVVVVYLRMDLQVIQASASRDGGATFAPPVLAASVASGGIPGLRALDLPSADVDARGRIYVAWYDCRFRLGCPSPPHDIVVASSPDGVRWDSPARVPISSRDGMLDHVIPGFAVDPASAGARARLAIVFYTVSAGRLTPEFVSSADGGRTWSAAVALATPFGLTDIAPTGGGAMVGDYVSTSFVERGIAVPVFSAATAPFDGSFHQPILAAAIAPLPPAPLRVVSFATMPRRPHPGRTLTAAVELEHLSPGARVACVATATRRPLRVVRRSAGETRASCTWRIPSRAAGALVRGSMTVSRRASAVRRTFALRVRARV